MKTASEYSGGVAADSKWREQHVKEPFSKFSWGFSQGSNVERSLVREDNNFQHFLKDIWLYVRWEQINTSFIS